MFKARHKLLSSILVASGGSLMFCSIALWRNDERFYRTTVMPLIHKLDPETSHRLAIVACKWAPATFFQTKQNDDKVLRTTLWNLTFSNPVGLAAGFDKHGEAVTCLHGLGFGFVEIGSVTPQPQPGNSKPRVFRLDIDKAVINRYGFNSDGHQTVRKRLEQVSQKPGGILGVNLGQNKTSTEAWLDYTKGVEMFGSVAHFMVVNISSPNTPGLRNLQKRKALEELIDKVLESRNRTAQHVPILIKIAPDLSHDELKDIAHVIMSKKVDGIVISNTTVTRPESLKSLHKCEARGLSGTPLREMSTNIIRDMYILTKGTVPIIGVGGVQSGQDAYDKIRAGASLIELYTALVYEGPPLVNRIKTKLTTLLKNDGYSSVADAVGVEHKKMAMAK